MISVRAIVAGLSREGAGIDVKLTDSTSRPLVAASANCEENPKIPPEAIGNIGAEAANFNMSRRVILFIRLRKKVVE